MSASWRIPEWSRIIPGSSDGNLPIGLLLLTAFVLWIGGVAVRRMEISYGGTDA
jgi:hypothetical protein